MNFTDLMSVVTILAGTLSGFVAAHSSKAGVMPLILFTVGGLLIGIGFGVACGNLAYRVYEAKKLSDWMQLILGSIISLTGLFAAMSVPPLLAGIIYG